jgi:CubicO group peptidase (beta-lactamase class C family)
MRDVMSFRSVLFPVVLCSLFLLAADLKAQQQNSVPVLELRIAETEPGDGLTKLEVANGEPIYLRPNVIIRENDIESVEAKEQPRRSGKAIIKLTKSGGKKLGVASEANLNKPMAILYNGSLVSAPLIRSKLDRDVVINGDFSAAQIDEMLEALQPRARVASFDAEELEKFSSRMDRALEKRIFSGTVLIAVDGKIVFEKSVGYANIDDKSPFTERSSFRLASVSKQFTAMGIMLLKEQGKLDFDDDITKHLPTLPYEGVTIRHLLHHTGGLPDYMDLFGKHWDVGAAEDSKKTAFNKDMVNLFAEHKPKRDFEPGKQYDYSNTGYVLLGHIIETASEQTVQEFFKTRIFDPLEMKDSFAFSVDETEFNPKSRVFGFAWQGDENVSNDWNYLNGMVGDGGIYASARDMLKWDQALYGEKLVSQTTLDEAFTSGKLDSGWRTGYGFGWMIDRSKNNGLTVSHGGAWVGFRTSIQRSIDRKLTVIVLSNNSTSKIDQILRAINEL